MTAATRPLPRTRPGSRPLPVDMETLRAHYFPAPPADTDVTRYQRAITRLDQLVAGVAAELDQAARREQDRTAALVAQAADEGPIDVTGLAPDDDRRHVEYRLALLRNARALALRRYNQAARHDERHLAWVAACQRIIDEWLVATMVEPAEQRVHALAAFAERHRT